MMTEVQRKPFIEAGARHLEDKRRQEPQPAQKRKSRNTEPLPDGVVGFDIIHPEFVADALRIMVRCAVCADLDPHIDDTRAKRGRYAKEDMCIAHKLAQLREHVWETWHVWGESGVIEELPPIFEEHEQQYTNADLSPFPVSCYLCAAP
ncbi:uncharacterized protein PHACADRAFT_257567 [Phanerochaete carnosa HHB-10118-sp]|uniref:Uncharacterized protein n=1 Tax=Phanerochaete carnosa (strain HHB-10118-sp) TaxID=650164 RepID=K5W4C0_PHACS|nr:uncharacterized protein PHACADRAFT_257567 [Phanerochaete carnosa HHB-10118-sp]EKM54005.1 hypothetical protein PHACADRAFT_257567 [Phanerochaete carnosa HHB-10118-sp]